MFFKLIKLQVTCMDSRLAGLGSQTRRANEIFARSATKPTAPHQVSVLHHLTSTSLKTLILPFSNGMFSSYFLPSDHDDENLKQIYTSKLQSCDEEQLYALWFLISWISCFFASISSRCKANNATDVSIRQLSYLQILASLLHGNSSS